MKSDPRQPNSDSTVIPPMRGFWLIAVTLLGLGLAVLPLDFALSNPTNLDFLPGDLTRIVDLSEIFAHGFGVALAAVGIWLLAPDKVRLIPRIAMCAFWPAAGVLLTKNLFGRVRPNEYLDHAPGGSFPNSIADTWIGWIPNQQFNILYETRSFPSAHAATALGLAIGLAWAFPKGRWLFFSVATLASIQRVTSHAHWPSDTFFGAAIAFVMAGALTQNWGLGYLFGRFENRNELKLLTAEDAIEDRRAA